MSATTRPYGTWPSPITSAALVEAAVGLGQPEVDAATGELYWIESRPLEAGRQVIVSAARGDAVPADVSVRTTVHEYGGGAYTADRGRLLFSAFADQRLYVIDAAGAAPRPLTPEPATRWELRYADMHVSPDGTRVVCVREHHRGAAATDVVNEVVTLPIDGSAAPEVVATGRDFYSTPRWSPDGTRLAYLAWDHPNMPWDGTELFVAGGAGNDTAHLVAGGPNESIVQPTWSPDAVLYYASDRSGWWNLYAEGNDAPLVARDAEFAGPAWLFGMRWFTFLADGRLVCTWGEGGRTRLGVFDAATGARREVPTPFGSINYPTAWRGNTIAAIGASPTASPAVVSIDVDADTDAIATLKSSRERDLDTAYVSVPEAIEFPTEGGATAHAFYYPPSNPDVAPLTGAAPPLLVISHGGPTSATRSDLSASIQFWTTRGFAVVDVNYGGSTGYGRAYRERLNGTWGITDVDDCINAARYLVDRGDADGDRLLIRGGSAGGYTTLCALVFRDAFAAGASYYGVADAELLARDTHKFESRYLDGLIGPYPADRDTYVARSPIHVAAQVTCPVILFQGLDDAVVPPAQAEVFVDAVRAKGLPFAYVAYEGEQHGFRKAENICHAADAELSFYARVLGFELPDGGIDLPIENLAT